MPQLCTDNGQIVAQIAHRAGPGVAGNIGSKGNVQPHYPADFLKAAVDIVLHLFILTAFRPDG